MNQTASACGAVLGRVAAGLAAALATTIALGANAQLTQLPDFTDLVERTAPAVVNIRTTTHVGGNAGPQSPELDENDPFNEFFRRFFPQPGGPNGPNGPSAPPGHSTPSPGPVPVPRTPGPEREMPRGVGSGFLLSADGYIMTNHHVVEGADEIIVTLPDRREFKGQLIGSDQRTDVALVKIDGTGLPLLKIGDPGRLKVGEWVIAIGSPFNLQSTVTQGIVSAKGRETGELLPFIQTDAAVNPGNSGGPLLNMRGEVVGINSQIFTTSGSFAGISFAIPIDEAIRVADLLRTQGRVIRGKIGVLIGEVSREVAEAIGLGKPTGALVTGLEADGPADKAGIEAGDVITRFDGKLVDSPNDLRRIVASTHPGAKSALTVWRGGASRDLQVVVGEMASDSSAASKPDRSHDVAKANALGLVVSDLTPDQLKELHQSGGVLVDSADGAAARAGIRVGDVITSVNNVAVKSAKEFNDLVAKLDLKRNIPLLVRRADSSQFLIVRPVDH